MQFSRVVRQGGRCRLCARQRVLPSDLQVDELDLPAVVLQRGADEAKYLLKHAQTSSVSVDGPGYCHQYQAVGGGQGPEALGLQIGAEEDLLVPGQSQETQADQLSPQELLHLLAASSENRDTALSSLFRFWVIFPKCIVTALVQAFTVCVKGAYHISQIILMVILYTEKLKTIGSVGPTQNK